MQWQPALTAAEAPTDLAGNPLANPTTVVAETGTADAEF
jgi:hypothetical protein